MSSICIQRAFHRKALVIFGSFLIQRFTPGKLKYALILQNYMYYPEYEQSSQTYTESFFNAIRFDNLSNVMNFSTIWHF